MPTTDRTDWPPTLPRKFPLTVTARGYIARIAGRPRWICGKLPPAEALKVYHRKAAVLTGGKAPLAEDVARRSPASPTIHYVLARWLIDREEDVRGGGLSDGAYAQYKLSAKRIDALVGPRLADDWTPDLTRKLYHRLRDDHGADFARRAMGHLRTACEHADEHDWVKRPVRLGRKVVAKLAARPAAKMKWKLYTPEQVRRILKRLDRRIAVAKGRKDGRVLPSLIQLRAMVLLALNGGYGAKELADLPREVIDLDRSLIDYERGKTGEEHVVPLWPETVDALRDAMALRPGDPLLFRTREGHPWCREVAIKRNGRLTGRVNRIDNVNDRFKELVGGGYERIGGKRVRRKGMGLRIAGQGFYKLKHLHATTADRAGDPHATFTLAGHGLPGAKGHYVAVGVDRLQKVVDFVRHELILSPPAGRSEGSPA